MAHELDQIPPNDLRSAEAQREIAVMDAAEHAGPLATAHAYETEATPSWVHRIAVGATTLATAFGTTEAAKADTTRAKASSETAEIASAPNIYETIFALRDNEKARAAAVGLEFLAPTDKEVLDEVKHAAQNSKYDEIKKVKVARKTAKSFTVTLHQQNERKNILFASLYDRANDPEAVHIDNKQLSVDTDVFTEKKVTLTPMLATSVKGNKVKLKKLGPSVTLDSLDNFSEDNIAYPAGNRKDSRHVTKATLKVPRLKARQLKGGKFYIDISQTSKSRLPNAAASVSRTFPSTYGRTKRLESGFAFRVDKDGKMTFVPGRHSKPGAVVNHTKKH